jgi:hypothetical protein
MESGSVERLAKNESFFRQVNERIKDVANGFDDGESYEFLCECSDPGCTVRIRLEPHEYEWVRANPMRFVLAPGHAAPQVEHVVEREENHQVVEKHGVAGHVAAKLDPRTAEG